MSMDAQSANESTAPSAAPTAPRVSISLSGGGYRAMIFAAGALLAVADSSLRDRVASISSVSGGSIASAVTIGGFAEPTADEPDPMGRRVSLLAALAQSAAIRTEASLAQSLGAASAFALLVAACFFVPAWWTLEEPTMVFVAIASFFGLLYIAVAVLPGSWYAVQAAVETLFAEANSGLDPTKGTALADIEAMETPRRIFCATDLSSGAHVYMSPGWVLAPNLVGRDPNIYLADVVAASACFPGLRPVVFNQSELGLGQAPSPPPLRRHNGPRLALGALGAAGLVLAVSAVAARIFGLVDSGWYGLAIAGGVAVVWGGVAFAMAHALRFKGELVLVDGGVCDNLGAAFTLLAEDDRYEDLSVIAGVDGQTKTLVVDASKPFTPTDAKGAGIGELLPLRMRGAQRSMVKLLGNANASARKQVITRLLKSPGSAGGAIVSVTGVPQQAGVDWAPLVARTSSTSTTLNELDPTRVCELLMHGYAVTQSSFEELDAVILRTRSVEEFAQLLFPASLSTGVLRRESFAKDFARAVHRGRGPYARQAHRVWWIANASLGVLALSVSIGTFWLYLQ